MDIETIQKMTEEVISDLKDMPPEEREEELKLIEEIFGKHYRTHFEIELKREVK